MDSSVVAAIDIGTSRTAYSYAVIGNKQEESKKSVHVGEEDDCEIMVVLRHRRDIARPSSLRPRALKV